MFLPREQQNVKARDGQRLGSTAPNERGGQVVGVGVGGDAKNEFQVFVGPKDIDLLRRVNPKLEGAVDFGWFSIIAQADLPDPALAARQLRAKLRLVHHPADARHQHAAAAAEALRHEGHEKDVGTAAGNPEDQREVSRALAFTDPKKAQQNEEIMALYKKHGVNPLGAGCMPLVLQIPFFFAFYKVLSVAIDLRGADWLWISDLSHFDPLYLLPVVMVITQFVLQRMTPNTTADPAQQKMMMFMPLIFGFLFFKASAGLVLYWLTSNLVSIAQQAFINRITPAPVPVAASPARRKQPAKTKARK